MLEDVGIHQADGEVEEQRESAAVCAWIAPFGTSDIRRARTFGGESVDS